MLKEFANKDQGGNLEISKRRGGHDGMRWFQGGRCITKVRSQSARSKVGPQSRNNHS